MFLKDFIGKKVLSYEGKILGYTRSAFFSNGLKRITALLCSDEDENDFILSLTQCQNVNDALIMPRRSPQKVTGMPYSPLLKQVYSVKGEFLGQVSNVVLDGVSVKAIIVNGKNYPTETIKAFGDCILINMNVGDSYKKSKGTKKNNNVRPQILIGKVLKFDILDDNGKLLFPKGLTITQNTLKSAALHRKLLELTSKTLYYSA